MLIKPGQLSILFLLFSSWFMLSQTAASEKTFYSLDQLMLSLAANGDSKASFTETRTSHLTRKPIESSGTLEFISPDRLIRRISRPKAMLFEVQGDEVIITRNGKRQSRSLAQLGAAQAFIESLRATLAGDRKTLQHYYQLELSSNASSWQLLLIPRDAELANKILEIRITGLLNSTGPQGRLLAEVTAVEVAERTGSITATRLETLE